MTSAGQLLRSGVTAEAFEKALAIPANDQLEERVRLLQRIPFEAILTTNFDNYLQGEAPGPEL